MRFVPPALLPLAASLSLLSCGRITNQGLDASAGTAPLEVDCTSTHPPASLTLVIPPARVDMRWLGWVHGAGGADLRVQGLPAGLRFDPTLGELSGTPAVAGTYPLSVTATPDACPEAATTALADLRVRPACLADSCGAPAGCGAPGADVLDAWIDGVPPGGWLAYDDVTIKAIDPDRIILSVPDREKTEVVIRTTLPGGPGLPLDPGTRGIDLRYHHGLHDDRYTFLTKHNATLLAVYRGHLPPAELEARCSERYSLFPDGTCFLPAFDLLPLACDGDCRPVALRTEDYGDLHAGDSGLDPPRAIRVVRGEICADASTPWWVELWVSAVGTNPLTEVHYTVAPGPSAPTAAVVQARQIPAGTANVKWSAKPLVGGFQPNITPDGWIDMPLVGRYVINGGCTGCELGQRTHDLLPRLTYRVEAWSDVPLDGVSLSVSGKPADRWGHRVLAMDLDQYPPPAKVVLQHHDPNGAAVSVQVRVVSIADIHNQKQVSLQPGQSWSFSD